jgi:hypothetical protein
MSKFFRRARAILAAFSEFPKVQLLAAVFPNQEKEFLFKRAVLLPSFQPGDMQTLLPADWSDGFKQMYCELEPACAPMAISLYMAQYHLLTGTMSAGMVVQDGKFFKNAQFVWLCHGDEPDIFKTICNYCGRGIADSFGITSPDELMIIEQGSYGALWHCALANLLIASKWRNPSVQTLSDPIGRFELHVCDNALQATWDALTQLLMLDTSDGPWSEADSPSQWAKRFNMSRDTLMRRFDDGSIRCRKLSTKNYRIHVSDLPKHK